MAASSATLMILPVVCGNRPTGNLFQIAAMSAKLSPKTELFWGKQTTQNDSRVHGRVSFQGPISRGHLKMEARFAKVVQNVRETVVPDPDYRIPVILLGSAAALIYKDNLLPAAPIGLLGLLLLFQTTRVRFVFDDESLEVKIGDQLKESGENVFVGGKNRWKYSTFVNWELWWPSFPVLVYFKETQTKPEGQVHFFPVIFNGKQLYDVMVERAGFSQNSGPK